MNMNQVINMVLRIIMRKAISGGIDAGMKQVGKARKARAPEPQRQRLEDMDPADMTPKQRVRAERRARRAAQATQDTPPQG